LMLSVGASMSYRKKFWCKVAVFCLCFGCWCLWRGLFWALFAGVLWCVSTWFVVRFDVGKRDV